MILSIAIVLFFLGCYLLMLFHFDQATKLAQEQINHVLELTEDHDGLENYLLGELGKREDIKPGSTKYISRLSAKSFMINELDTSIISSNENPFSDVIIFNLRSEASINGVRDDLNALPGVKQVHLQSLEMDALRSNILKFGWLVLALAIIFGLMSLALIFSTIQLQLYADRFEIKTMELVGADDRFIKMPYLRRAFKMANWSVLLSAFVLIACFILLKINFAFFEDLFSFNKLVLVLISMWLFAVVFLLMASNHLINKYLSKKMQDLYR